MGNNFGRFAPNMAGLLVFVSLAGFCHLSHGQIVVNGPPSQSSFQIVVTNNWYTNTVQFEIAQNPSFAAPTQIYRETTGSSLYTFSGMAASTAYYVRARGVVGGNWTGWSNVLTVTTAAIPGPVISLSGSPCATSFTVYSNTRPTYEISETASFDSYETKTANNVGNTTFQGLQPGKRYFVRGYVYQGSYSDYSNVVSVVLPNPGIEGPRTIAFSGQATAAYSVQGTVQSWAVPAGFTIVSGQGTSSIQVQISGAFTSGTVQAHGTFDGCGTVQTVTADVEREPFEIHAASPSVVSLSRNGESMDVLLDCGGGFGSCSLPSSVTITAPDFILAEKYGPYVRVTLVEHPGSQASWFVDFRENQSVIFRLRVQVAETGAGSGDQNYIKETTILKAGVTAHSEVMGLPVSEKSVTTTYYDGLGRPMQEVGWQASPGKKDIVRPIVYDEYGRQARDYLPFASSGSNGWYRPNGGLVDPVTGLYTGEAASFYAPGSNNRIADDLRPFSETVFEASPLNRPERNYGPGQDWHGKDKYVEHRYLANVHGTGAGQERVIAWDIDASGMPIRNAPVSGHVSTGGYYLSGQLYVKATTDEHGNTVREYTDKLGRVVLKKVQAVEDPALGNRDHWAQTYYIYDDFGNLRFVLQPELVKKAMQGDSYVPTQADLDGLAFQYRYDHRRRMTVKQIPGAAPVYMVYDGRDRLVLTQDGNQRGEGEWTFTKYDALNRPVSTGVYPHTATTQQAMQAVLDAFYANAPANKYYEERGSAVHGYTNRSFPLVGNEGAYHTITYYDDYGFKDLIGGTAYDYKDDELAGQETAENPHVKGLVTGSKTKVLGTTEYLWAVTYYDKKYRPTQMVTQNHPQGLDRVTSLYNFPGWLMETRLSHQGEEAVTVHMAHTYDHAGRLLETWHTINNGDPVLLSKNGYNELGELVKKHLHKEGNAFAQSVDYRYNIRGWLERINNSDLSPDTGDDRGDLFGMELSYNEGFEVPQYNGNISGARWKNAVDNTERAYGYTYDPMNRLTGADYTAGGTGDWEQEEHRFEVGNITYDHNGNILTLHRNGLFRQLPMEAPEYGVTDQLTYHYRGNRLMAVNDAMDTPEGSRSDFRDNGSKGTVENPEYEYDANGNMTADGNKGITVGYNHLNLPERVDFGNGKHIEYTYDAAGTKLRQEVHDGEGPAKRTDYVGGMVYEDGQLQFIQHGEGRIVMVDNDGLSKLPEYQYHLKDHLGNVRLTFSATPETEGSTATLETAHEEEEHATFLRYAETTKINSTFFDHTNNGDTHYAIRLNGSENERIGLAKSLAVMTGDTIRAEVFAKYLNPDPDNWTTALQGLMAAIAAGTAPAGTVIEAVPPVGGDGLPFEGLLDAAKANDTGTRAYLNILLFDEGLTFLDAAFVPVTDAAMENGTNVPHERLAEEVIVQQPGYAYIYLSNDNDQPLEVFFDDFTVEHVHSAIVQVDDYYPFGLSFNSYKRENSVANKYLYNGKEHQTHFGLDWYDYGARMYMADIGRWGAVDPLAEIALDWTPYRYGFNNPLSTIDPTGMYEVYVNGARVKGDEKDEAVRLFGLPTRGGGNDESRNDNSHGDDNNEGQVKGGQIADNGPGVGYRKDKDGSYSRFDADHKCGPNCTLDHWATEDQLRANGELLMLFVGGEAVKLVFRAGRWVVSGMRAAKGGIAIGQRHHLLSNKIMRALNSHPSLKGAFNRENAKYIYNALDDAAHKGYQTWHRQYDATVVKWLQSNPSATPAQFNKYLHNLHQQPWLKNRIPNVNLLD